MFVRPATVQDVAFLTDVEVVTTRASGRALPEEERSFRAGLDGRTLAELRGEVEGSETRVIEIDGARAGRFWVTRALDHVELCALQLLPAHQGRGIGTYLVNRFLDAARDAGLVARLRVERDNPRARSLYERLGFVVVDGDDTHEHLEWRAFVRS